VVDFQNGMNDERVAAVAGRGRTLGCVITIGAGLYEPGHAMRTDAGAVGFKVGELDGRDTARVRELARVVSEVAPATVTTNLFGERWSKLAVNCMANPLAGLSGLGTAEVRTEPGAQARRPDALQREGRGALPPPSGRDAHARSRAPRAPPRDAPVTPAGATSA